MSERLVNQIIGGIAEAEGVEPIQLDVRLHEHVSVDAIQSLVVHDSDAWRLQFETPAHVVEVTGNDEILVDGEQYRTLP